MVTTRRDDRELVLARLDAKKKDIGLVDPKILEGTNKLRCVRDDSTCMWSFKYDHGLVPSELRGKYTSFNDAKKHADIYLSTRNLKIAKVID